jgi:hypothetical protein
MATGYGLDGQLSNPDSGKIFSVLQNVQTGSGSHPASYPMDSVGDFLRG